MVGLCVCFVCILLLTFLPFIFILFYMLKLQVFLNRKEREREREIMWRWSGVKERTSHVAPRRYTVQNRCDAFVLFLRWLYIYLLSISFLLLIFPCEGLFLVQSFLSRYYYSHWCPILFCFWWPFLSR